MQLAERGGGDGITSERIVENFERSLGADVHITKFWTDIFENILREALRHGTPEIFNMDQGAQFTAKSFLDILRVEHADRAIKISMDGKGRALDNVFIERLWRTVKYEDVYLKDYETIADVRVGLQEYFSYYCHERPHRTLGDCTPFAVYQAGCERQSAA